LASLAARADTPGESFQIDDKSKNWLTEQVFRLSIANGFYSKSPIMLCHTKHFASPDQQLILTYTRGFGKRGSIWT
jgi:hypothetical protein